MLLNRTRLSRRGCWLSFGFGFVVPVLWAIAYWSFFEGRIAEAADRVGGVLFNITCPPTLLRTDIIALPFLNGILYLSVFVLIQWVRSALVTKQD